MRARIIPGFVQMGVPRGRILVILDRDAAALGPPRVAASSAGLSLFPRPTTTDGIADAAVTSLRAALETRGAVPYAFTIDGPTGDVVDVTVSIGDAAHGGTGTKVVARSSFSPVPATVPSDGLRIAVATCYYDYGGGAPSYASALRTPPFGPPHLKILAGDNVYLDVVPGQIYRSNANEETAEVYARYFFESEYANVLEGSPNVTTWDDHEYWNNFPEEQIHLTRSQPSHRAAYEASASAALELFQRPLNPGQSGTARSYEFAVDPIRFFVADLRTRRTKYHDEPRTMLPDGELKHLTRWARSLDAPGVLVIGQPLWIESGGETDYTPPDFEEQYGEIWSALEDAPFDVVVLTGDVHHSRVLSIGLRRGRILEVTTSPAVHIPSTPGVALGSLMGRSFGQDHGRVAYPGNVPIAPRFGVSPRVNELLFAHEEPNTFAMLRLRPVGQDRLDVNIAMIDHRTGAIPESRGSDLHTATHRRCSNEGAVSLLRR